MNMRFRQLSSNSKGPSAETLAIKPNKGDKVRVFGYPETYIVDEVGMKLVKLHQEDNTAKKMSAFRKDVVKLF